MKLGAWTLRLPVTAEANYNGIMRWTVKRFGAAQAASHGAPVGETLAGLERGLAVAGTRQREEIGAGLRTLHVGRPGRHIILFRIASEPDRTIDVSRILHGAIDLARHVER
jgi:toxin ParE1/3/4